MTCKCTTGCRTNTCRYRKNSHGCTEAGLCPENTCTNSKRASSTTCDEEYDGDCNLECEEEDDDG